MFAAGCILFSFGIEAIDVFLSFSRTGPSLASLSLVASWEGLRNEEWAIDPLTLPLS